MEQTVMAQTLSEQDLVEPNNGKEKKLLYFLGSGNMAAAIGRGLAACSHVPLRLGFYDVNAEKAQELAAEVGGQAALTLAEAAQADVLLLAVKPQDMPALVDELAPLLRPGQLVLTIAAGLPLAWYQARLPQGTPLVRAMPNTSAAVGEAITGLMAGEFATDAHKTLAEQVFAAVGSFIWLAEEEIHALTAISGSGPAYYYYFTEALAAAGEALGLSPQTAAALARRWGLPAVGGSDAHSRCEVGNARTWVQAEALTLCPSVNGPLTALTEFALVCRLLQALKLLKVELPTSLEILVRAYLMMFLSDDCTLSDEGAFAWVVGGASIPFAA